MNPLSRFSIQHDALSRRYFLRVGGAGVLAWGLARQRGSAAEREAELETAIDKMGPLFTAPDDFQDVSRGDPIPHEIPEEQKQACGLTRDTWRLEVIADPDHPPAVRRPMSKAAGTAFDFAGLQQLAEKHAVRFAKVMTCLNIGCPLGMGVWEGVPLRELVALARPGDDVRRVFYYGYHNDKPEQMFRSSLPMARVLEDPFDLPPVIVCYKLNGNWLTSERGGPVRIVVPEAYGFKCIKWLTHVVLTNLPHANDTYADDGNDVDSPLKSFAATLNAPVEAKADVPFAVTGYAQVGIGGVSKVQVWLQNDAEERPSGDRYLTQAPWRDAEILPAPVHWGGALPDDRIPNGTQGFDDLGRPLNWPMRLGKIHWATLHPGLPAGEYTLRCRTVDDKGVGQPLPRPQRRSGHAAIEQLPLKVR
jgi:DMSO/TMAO reductase YedYZ molybdopterin-dependent catalytic subunit